jgi:hypothetical protein
MNSTISFLGKNVEEPNDGADEADGADAFLEIVEVLEV